MKHPVEYHYSIMDIVKRFGFTRHYVLYAIHCGDLPAIKFRKPKSWIGFTWRIPASGLEMWINAMK